jgi:hypothetical protein
MSRVVVAQCEIVTAQTLSDVFTLNSQIVGYRESTRHPSRRDVREIPIRAVVDDAFQTYVPAINDDV